ncbi:MAG: hypothetical protein M3X11_13040 [Acidobacteriota bacterium]|nr:hypothetical protein [Acidobacteriota bacterium]
MPTQAINDVFADTFYYFALLSPSDVTHQLASTVTPTLSGRIITTAWVVAELAAAFSVPPRRARCLALIDHLYADPQITVIPPSPELFDAGLALYRNRPDKGWSLTDCISFIVMEREGLTEALTGDHHFEQAGFTALLK